VISHQGSELPVELKLVDRSCIVYVSSHRFHHPDCVEVKAWHRNASHSSVKFRKEKYENIADKVTFKPCQRCAKRFGFTFHVGTELRSSPYPSQ